MTAAVVLAAGASRRLGRPKQTLVLGGEMLVERAVRVATEAGLSPVIAVVQDNFLLETLEAAGAEVRLNRQWFEGMATSIVTGVRWAENCGAEGVLIMPCDQPGLTAEHLRSLCAEPGRMTGSLYAGRTGVPAYFPASAFPQLLQLKGEAGARHMLQSAATVPCEALELDIDTPDDIERAESLGCIEN